MCAKLGPAGAVTALAHKLAQILYTLIKTHPAFDPRKLGNPAFVRQRQERSLRKQAALLGFSLQPSSTRWRTKPGTHFAAFLNSSASSEIFPGPKENTVTLASRKRKGAAPVNLSGSERIAASASLSAVA